MLLVKKKIAMRRINAILSAGGAENDQLYISIAGMAAILLG